MAFKLPGYSSGSHVPLHLFGSHYPNNGGALDAAAKRYGFLFQASVSQNMTGFVFGSAANGGTVTNIAQADLYAVDANGAPTGSKLASEVFTPVASNLNTVVWGDVYTDLVIDHTTNTNCTSAAKPFIAADIGKTLNITSGTGFTVQAVTVSSVAGGVATCSAALGTVDSTGGTTSALPVAVTAGTCYAVVMLNRDATPATNKFTLTGSIVGTAQWASVMNANNLTLASTDSGATWNGASNTWTTLSGSLVAAPVYATLGIDAPSVLTAGGSGNFPVNLYNAAGTRTARAAIKVNFPHDVLIWGVQAAFSVKVSTPTFNLCAEICSASASLSTSAAVRNAVATDSVVNTFWWNVPYRCNANTDYYIGITPAEVGDGSASKYVIVQAFTPLVKTPTIGPIYGGYESTASGNPSWSQSASLIPQIAIYAEIPGGGGMTVVGP